MNKGIFRGFSKLVLSAALSGKKIRLANRRPGSMLVQSLGPENPLEKDVATHSSVLTWEISWTAEPGRPQSTGSQRVRDDLATKEQHGPVKRGRQDSIEYGGREAAPPGTLSWVWTRHCWFSAPQPLSPSSWIKGPWFKKRKEKKLCMRQRHKQSRWVPFKGWIVLGLSQSRNPRPLCCDRLDQSTGPILADEEKAALGRVFSLGMLPPRLSPISRVRLSATPWAAASQAPLSTGFSR